MIRVLVAGVLGGVVVFGCGFVEHMIFGWVGRAFSQFPSESAVAEFMKSQELKPGIYMFPQMPPDMPKDQKDRIYEEINQRYKQGPNGMLVVGPTGEDMMGPQQLGFEAATNVVAALIAAWIVSMLAPSTIFPARWLVVLLMGAMAWFSISASYAIWYRFPWPFILDELYCALLEWGVAGLVITAIAKPRANA
jgi:hypothetical protein